jgi:glutathione S-transferase
LEIEGGKCLAQSKAICRYLAKQTGQCTPFRTFSLNGVIMRSYSGLVPHGDWDAARCDMVVDYVDDFRNPLGEFYFDDDSDAKVRVIVYH